MELHEEALAKTLGVSSLHYEASPLLVQPISRRGVTDGLSRNAEVGARVLATRTQLKSIKSEHGYNA